MEGDQRIDIRESSFSSPMQANLQTAVATDSDNGDRLAREHWCADWHKWLNWLVGGDHAIEMHD